jgi:hypothetical protein
MIFSGSHSEKTAEKPERLFKDFSREYVDIMANNPEETDRTILTNSKSCEM